ncbi:MAG TPA: helical backbone metal receptor [Burkholderiales bacterium]|nr:helical backbone metal receptor [Burkholderiales bacterium]
MSRIVSLVPSITELLCDLGLTEQIVGRTGFCIHPREIVRRIPKVGGTKSVNIGKIRALEPTHVIVNVDENEKPTADAIWQFVPHLVVTHPLAPLDNLALYRQMGALFNKEREAEELCARFQAEYDEAVSRSYTQRNALYLIWKDPWMTVSRDTYISRTIALFGLNTLPADATDRYPKLTLDEPWLSGVEEILLSSEPYAFREKHLREVSGRLGKPARLIDGEMTSWYGSRAIRGLGYLAQFVKK